MIRLYEIKLNIGQGEDCLKQTVYKRLARFCREVDGDTMKISGKAVDARDKRSIKYVYSVDFKLKKNGYKRETDFVSIVRGSNRRIRIEQIQDVAYDPVVSFDPALSANPAFTPNTVSANGSSPIIAGFGPAGIFAGILLARNGLKPVIIERGKSIEERVCDVELFWKECVFDSDSNPLYGEGGAGTFSDGKLTTGRSDVRIPFILQEFVNAGAPEDILYTKKPHIGTDKLRIVVPNLRKNIEALGGKILFSTKLTGLSVHTGADADAIRSVETEDLVSGNICETDTDALILATGHSARDTYSRLNSQGLLMEQKPFSIGLRIEHEQKMIDSSQYGEEFDQIYGMSLKESGLPPAEYKMSHRASDGRGVYTFCMCPGGEIITVSAEEGTVGVNGMSNRDRNAEKANSAILVDVRTEDYGSDEPLAGIEFQREYERRAYRSGLSGYEAPGETVGEFLNEGSSRLARCLPDFAAKGIREGIGAFGKKIKGFDDPSAVLKGIESGSSSPVRIPRGDDFTGSIRGVYPCGEGAGYAGGITSAALDGLKCAEAVVRSFTR